MTGIAKIAQTEEQLDEAQHEAQPEIIKGSVDMSTALMPKSLGQAFRLADRLAESTLVPDEYKCQAGSILAAIQMGAQLGMQPLQAMQSITVIKGKPTLYGDALPALVRGSGLAEYIKESIDGEGINRTATYRVKRKGEDEVVRTFSMADAKRAGLLGKGNWQTYPDRMLRARARGFALRDVFPDVLKGFITKEEAEDMPDEKHGGKLLPIVEEAESVTSQVQRILCELYDLGVSKEQVEQRLGTGLNRATIAQIADLSEASEAIKNGAAISDYFGEDGEPLPQNDEPKSRVITATERAKEAILAQDKAQDPDDHS